MSIFKKTKSVLNKFPYVRRPKNDSKIDYLFNQLAWSFQHRNKSLNIGWETYKQASKFVWVNACIHAYVDTVNMLGFTINNPDSELVDATHVTYLNDLFNYPMGMNHEDSFTKLNTLLWKSLLIYGDAFCEVIYDPEYSKVPVGLKHIPTRLMTFHEETAQWGVLGTNTFYENDELIHICEPDPDGGLWGESKIDILAKDITLDLLGRKRTNDILKNKGLDPRGAIIFDKDITDDVWNEEITRLQVEANSNQTGNIILRGGTYTNLGSTNRDLEYTNLMNDVRSRVLAVYGVPPAMISIIETANLGSGSGVSQMKTFKNKLRGKCKLFEEEYKRVIGRSGFKEIFFYGNFDIDDELITAQVENIRLGNGSVYINELRGERGLEPVNWGDEPFNINNGVQNQEESSVQLSQNNNYAPYKKVLENEGLIKRI